MLQLSTVSSLPVGVPVKSLRRVLFCQGAELHGSEGPLEIGFANGHTILFECGASGEDLKVSEGPWEDPFVEPLSRENEQFLLHSGKWEVLDLGASVWSYRRFVGRVLDLVEMRSSNTVHLVLGDASIDIAATADELSVKFSQA